MICTQCNMGSKCDVTPLHCGNIVMIYKNKNWISMTSALCWCKNLINRSCLRWMPKAYQGYTCIYKREQQTSRREEMYTNASASACAYARACVRTANVCICVRWQSKNTWANAQLKKIRICADTYKCTTNMGSHGKNCKLVQVFQREERDERYMWENQSNKACIGRNRWIRQHRKSGRETTSFQRNHSFTQKHASKHKMDILEGMLCDKQTSWRHLVAWCKVWTKTNRKTIEVSYLRYD